MLLLFSNLQLKSTILAKMGKEKRNLARIQAITYRIIWKVAPIQTLEIKLPTAGVLITNPIARLVFPQSALILRVLAARATDRDP